MAESDKGLARIVFVGGAGVTVEGSAEQVQSEISLSRAADLAKFTKALGEGSVYVVAANVAYIEDAQPSTVTIA